MIASGLDESVLASAELTAREFGLEVLGAIRKPLTARRLLEAVGLHGADKPERRPRRAPGELADTGRDRPRRRPAGGARGPRRHAGAGARGGRRPAARRSSSSAPPRTCSSSTRPRHDLASSTARGLAERRALLTRLRVHGFGLGVADFGAGRATLADLARLPLTEVQLAARIVQATGSRRGAGGDGRGAARRA